MVVLHLYFESKYLYIHLYIDKPLIYAYIARKSGCLIHFGNTNETHDTSMSKFNIQPDSQANA